jgi:bifunctional non-homologous end joining protein LigD
MSALLDRLSPAERELARVRVQPRWAAPMLATLMDGCFDAGDWLFERKLDGERCVAFREGGTVRLMSRNQQELTHTYPELVRALEEQDVEPFLADGEIVAFSGGRTSFKRLQERMRIQDPEEARRSEVTVCYYLFDLLHLRGVDLTGLPLRRRKSLLRESLCFRDPLRYLPHRNAAGREYHALACDRGWDGVLAKRADAPYRAGRSGDWLKCKCVPGQELVIGGYTRPGKERAGFGSLLLGYYDRDQLRYAGKVGTGFDATALQSLAAKLRLLERATTPFGGAGAPRRGARWVAPDLVAEIGFSGWTPQGRVRNPRFLGLRRDKDPEDVVRETAPGLA